MSIVHNTQVNKVEVRDGTVPPSDEAKRIARMNNREKPHELGHKHAQGRVRTTDRYAWVCRCGKTSNGCTYPDASSAGAAGRHHRDAANLRLKAAPATRVV